jgi:hypothetical protein
MLNLTAKRAGKLARANGFKLPKIGKCIRLKNGKELCHDAHGYYIPGPTEATEKFFGSNPPKRKNLGRSHKEALFQIWTRPLKDRRISEKTYQGLANRGLGHFFPIIDGKGKFELNYGGQSAAKQIANERGWKRENPPRRRRTSKRRRKTSARQRVVSKLRTYNVGFKKAWKPRWSKRWTYKGYGVRKSATIKARNKTEMIKKLKAKFGKRIRHIRVGSYWDGRVSR